MANKSGQKNKELDLTHIDAALQAHTSRLSKHGVRHYRRGVIFAVVIVGMLLMALAAATPHLISTSDDSDSPEPYTPLIMPTESVATPTVDPNSNLPESVRQSISAWPSTASKDLIFKPASSVPLSIEESEALYDTLAAVAAQYPSVTFTLTAYAGDPTAQQLAELRLEYMHSQLAENKIARARVTQTILPTSESDPNQSDSIQVSRSLFPDEKAPQ